MMSHQPARYIPVIIVDDIEEQQPSYDSVVGTRGVCYVCPKCGKLWATITLFTLPYGASEPFRADYAARNHFCREHGGGSFLDGYVHAISPWNTMRAMFGPKIAARELEIEWERMNGG